jgi:putative ABC transport system permease protein
VTLIKLIFRNTLRQRLRTILTLVGMAVAILAFCLLRTVVDAWYAGVAGSAPDRLVTRNSVSLIFTLPISYRTRILQVPGVREVVYANWFGGVYIDERHFFPRIAVGPQSYFDVYPELVISPAELKAFWRQRNACIAGRKIAEKYGWKIGDTITMNGNIYPGEWSFVLRGVYHGATKTTDETQFLFRWDYLDETLRKTAPREAGQIGWYIVQVQDPTKAGAISSSVDALFASSLAETLTETEKAFQLGFVAMTEAIVIAIRIVSFVVIGVILLILANTMAMAARERMSEYAVLKTMGFGNLFLTILISGESVVIAMLGGVLGMMLSFPSASIFSSKMGSLLPVFHISGKTLVMSSILSIVIGLLASVFPAWRASRVHIAEALGHVG